MGSILNLTRGKYLNYTTRKSGGMSLSGLTTTKKTLSTTKGGQAAALNITIARAGEKSI